MPTDVLFIHSAGSQSCGKGSSPFVQHLRDGLSSGYSVICPKMPAPMKPSYARWKRELDKFLLAENVPRILVGHSLGGSVLLKYLSEQSPRLKPSSLFIVSSPYWGSEDWQVEEFILHTDFAKLLPNNLKVYLYQSIDDEVVPVEHLSFIPRLFQAQ